MKISEHALRALKDHPEHDSYEFCQEQIIPNRGGGYCFFRECGLDGVYNPKDWKIYKISSVIGDQATLYSPDLYHKEINLKHYFYVRRLYFLDKVADEPVKQYAGEEANSQTGTSIGMKGLTGEISSTTLRDKTQYLIDESSEILMNSTRVRKAADNLYNELRKLDKEKSPEKADEEGGTEEPVISDEEFNSLFENNASANEPSDRLPAENQKNAEAKAYVGTASDKTAVVKEVFKQAEQDAEDRIKPYKGDKSFLFISYAHRDTKLVYPIIRHMQGMGLRVWFDEGIVPGKEWDDYVAERVLKCDAMIAFISPNYLKSSNCRDELNYARDEEKERLLIYLENVKLTPGMAMRMNRIQAIHQYAYSKQSDFYEKLMDCHFVARNCSNGQEE